MLNYYIYLVGQISAKEMETYEWRRKIRNRFELKNSESETVKFTVIDPCFNAFNQSLIQEDYTDYSNVYRENNINILTPKDKMYVEKSNIAIANLIQYDEQKPLIGSCFELAWYHMYNGKTVIGIHNDKDSIYYKHPFIQDTITTWVENEEEAYKVISFYFDV